MTLVLRHLLVVGSTPPPAGGRRTGVEDGRNGDVVSKTARRTDTNRARGGHHSLGLLTVVAWGHYSAHSWPAYLEQEKDADVTPAINQVSRGGTLRLAFSSAVVSLVAAFAAVGSTIPLFNLYRAEEGFSNADISMTVVAYSTATLTTRLVMGRLSNYLGRRPCRCRISCHRL
jgi:hypothetical protein